MTVARWIFQSPRRVIVTAITAASGLALLLTLIVTSGSGHHAALRPDVAVALAPLDPATATQVGQEFVALWCEQGARSPDQWATEMRGRSTPDFARYWTPASTQNLTSDCPWGYAKPRLTEPAKVRVLVMTKGNPVLVDVVQTARGPRVDGIAPDDEGDL